MKRLLDRAAAAFLGLLLLAILGVVGVMGWLCGWLAYAGAMVEMPWLFTVTALSATLMAVLAVVWILQTIGDGLRGRLASEELFP